MTINELSRRNVINIRDATNFGTPCDVAFDVCTGKITELIVSKGASKFSLARESEITIPWCAVVRVGDGAILVDIDPPAKKCKKCDGEKRRQFPFF